MSLKLPVVIVPSRARFSPWPGLLHARVGDRAFVRPTGANGWAQHAVEVDVSVVFVQARDGSLVPLACTERGKGN